MSVGTHLGFRCPRTLSPESRSKRKFKKGRNRDESVVSKVVIVVYRKKVSTLS